MQGGSHYKPRPVIEAERRASRSEQALEKSRSKFAKQQSEINELREQITALQTDRDYWQAKAKALADRLFRSREAQPSAPHSEEEIIYGVAAIGRAINMREKQVSRLIRIGVIKALRRDGIVSIRKSELADLMISNNSASCDVEHLNG